MGDVVPRPITRAIQWQKMQLQPWFSGSSRQIWALSPGQSSRRAVWPEWLSPRRAANQICAPCSCCACRSAGTGALSVSLSLLLPFPQGCLALASAIERPIPASMSPAAPWSWFSLLLPSPFSRGTKSKAD